MNTRHSKTAGGRSGGCTAAATFGVVPRLHRDQRGTISIVSVFAMLLLAMLLGMVMNAGRQVDAKIRMQNAADASAYSGGVVLARGMNTLAFTNHLLCDVFALTSFMREARDRNSEKYVPDILGAWSKVAPLFSSSGFPKFERLGPAITQKVPLEQEMVRAYSEWAAAASDCILPLIEEILAGELIPQYQRAVLTTFPEIAQMAAMAVAQHNGDPDFGRGKMLGAFWRTSGRIVGGEDEAVDPSLPVVDPTTATDPHYMTDARKQRDSMAQKYLNDWNNQAMLAFDREAKMSQFGALWRSFTCGYLKKLTQEEYPETNMPFQIRVSLKEIKEGTVDANAHVEQNFMFVGVVYWRNPQVMLSRLFKNPMDSDSVAYAQVQVFMPQQRLEWHWFVPGGGSSDIQLGGVPGDFASLPSGDPPTSGGGGAGRWVVGRQGVPTSWDLMTQHWTCQLVPATGPNLPTILQTLPPLPDFQGANLTLPNLGGLDTQDIVRISPH